MLKVKGELNFIYKRPWQTKPLQGKNLEINVSLFISQKLSRPTACQGCKVAEVTVLGITCLWVMRVHPGSQPPLLLAVVGSLGNAYACAGHGWSSAPPEQKVKAVFGACSSRYLLPSSNWSFLHISYHGFLWAPQTRFSLPSFLIRTALWFGEVCLEWHCTHLFGKNQKHFSLSLNYCCQVLCGLVLQAILQRELPNLESWCARLQQRKWLRSGNTRLLLSVRFQKEGVLLQDWNSNVAAQPLNSKHLSSPLHSHLLSSFSNSW